MLDSDKEFTTVQRFSHQKSNYALDAVSTAGDWRVPRLEQDTGVGSRLRCASYSESILKSHNVITTQDYLLF